MPRRRLSPDERAAWQQLARTVRPMAPARSARDEADGEATTKPRTDAARPLTLTSGPADPVQPAARPAPADILDGGWERRIRRGLLQPEMSIDLHGYSLALAHRQFNRALADALGRGVRVLLVITGKPRDREPMTDRPGRGAIRAEISHWIDASPYFDRIASVRRAHPRHGGEGAIYLILRRGKQEFSHPVNRVS